MKKTRIFLSLMSGLSAISAASADLVAHYTFDDPEDPGANSGSAEIEWAAFTGVTQSANGKFGGGSGSFVRGTSQAITGSFAATSARLERFSLSMHVHSNMGLAYLDLFWPDLVSIGNDQGYSQFVIEATGPGGGIALYKFSSPTTTDAEALGSITSNTWHHLGVVSDGTTVTLYINGVVRGNPIPYTASGAIGAFGFAERYGSTTRGFTALIDDVAIYDEALTAEQMAWLTQNAAVANVPISGDPQFLSYDDWALQIPDPERRGEEMDYDEDGFTNLAEYFFGTSPLVFDGPLVTAEMSGTGKLVVRWLQLESGADYRLEQNATLQGEWAHAEGMIPVEDSDRTAPDHYVSMKAETDIGSGSNFVRVRASFAAEMPDP